MLIAIEGAHASPVLIGSFSGSEMPGYIKPPLFKHSVLRPIANSSEVRLGKGS